jgi:hypothetical protein
MEKAESGAAAAGASAAELVTRARQRAVTKREEATTIMFCKLERKWRRLNQEQQLQEHQQQKAQSHWKTETMANRAVSRSSCRWLNLRSGMHAHGKVDTPERQARILPADSTGSGRLLEFRELGLLAVALNLLLISESLPLSRSRSNLPSSWFVWLKRKSVFALQIA